MTKISNAQKISLTINGLIIPTTMGRLRNGSQSSCVAQLVVDFENIRNLYKSEGKAPPIGYCSSYLDFSERTHMLQISLS